MPNMNIANNPFSLFCRTGFEEFEINQEYFSNKVPVAKTYSLCTPFKEVLPFILNCNAPYILFVDNPLYATINYRKIIKLVKRHDKINAITFDSESLSDLFGIESDNHKRRHAVSQTAYKIPVLPSWCSIVSKEIIEKSGLFNSEWNTLEFFLFELSEWLINNENSIIRFDNVKIRMDLQSWCSNQIYYNAKALAADYFRSINYSKNQSNFKVPEQFRIELVGQYITPTKTNISPHIEKQPLFSIICPAFRPTYFKDMLDSILKQTWQDWELVIVIDGPPETEKQELCDILDRHQSDSRIRYNIQENSGTGPTRQRLVTIAKGKFILSIDDDDMLPAEALEIFACAVKQNPNVQIFRGGTQLIELINMYLPPRQRIIINNITNDLFEVNQPYLIQRKLIEQLGGFEGHECFRYAGEDSDFFHKADQARIKTCLINKPLYQRRISNTNQSLGLTPEEGLAHIKLLNHRHCKKDWELSDIKFKSEDDFVRQISTYRHLHSTKKVICATRYFNFRTLGPSEDIIVDLEITTACNAKCVFCPRNTLHDVSSFITKEKVHWLSSYIKNEPSIKQIVLCGIGEPFLHPELYHISKILSGAGLKLGITTNGSFIDTENFIKLAEAGINEFNFSINADTSKTHKKIMSLNNFETVINKIKKVLNLKQRQFPEIEINVSFVYCAHNQHELSDFINRWRNTGVSRIWIHPLNNRAGLIDDSLKPLDISFVAESYGNDEKVIVDVFKNRNSMNDICKIARSMHFISADGQMRLCAMDYKRQITFGSLKHENLQNMHINKIARYKESEIQQYCRPCSFS